MTSMMTVNDQYDDCVDDQYDDCWWQVWWLLMTSVMKYDDSFDDKYDDSVNDQYDDSVDDQYDISVDDKYGDCWWQVWWLLITSMMTLLMTSMTLLFSNCTDCFMSQVWCPLASVLSLSSLSSWSFSSWKCCEKAKVSVLLVQHHILRESGQGEPIQKLQCHLTALPWYEIALYLSLLLTLHGPSMYSFRAERITQTPANSTFSHPITFYFQCCAFWWKSVYMPVQKRRQKGWRVSNLVLLLVVFKWHHGREGVKDLWGSLDSRDQKTKQKNTTHKNRGMGGGGGGAEERDESDLRSSHSWSQTLALLGLCRNTLTPARTPRLP